MISDGAKNVMIWILSIILFGAFAIAGVSKLLGVEEQVNDIASWDYPTWSIYPIGIIEILLALGYLVPRMRIWTVRATYIWALVAFITHWQADQLHLVWGSIIFSLLAFVVGTIHRSKSNLEANI
ncbi:MAG: hypothetical protein SchgKO_15600 [Schleiferiaceae bacterium]